MVDYKDKHFVLQDKLSDKVWDFEIGEMSEDQITDSFLEEHVDCCIIYGIPAYIGSDQKLKDRVNALYEKYGDQLM